MAENLAADNSVAVNPAAVDPSTCPLPFCIDITTLASQIFSIRLELPNPRLEPLSPEELAAFLAALPGLPLRQVGKVFSLFGYGNASGRIRQHWTAVLANAQTWPVNLQERLEPLEIPQDLGRSSFSVPHGPVPSITTTVVKQDDTHAIASIKIEVRFTQESAASAGQLLADLTEWYGSFDYYRVLHLNEYQEVFLQERVSLERLLNWHNIIKKPGWWREYYAPRPH